MDTLSQGLIADRYHLEALVGEGGMGAVYRAVDQRTARTVAVKIIRDAGASDLRMVRLFNREIRAVARLDHPGVVQVLDHGVDHNGRPFYVMEFISGCSLAQLPVEAFSWADVRFVIEALLRTLAYAHARGVVHRDLKPENILITAAPQKALKLVDFGIAKISEEVENAGHVAGTSELASPKKTHGTLLGDRTVGTPAYMAPEQAQGRSRQIGPASDLYAVGCLLFQLLSGRTPFHAPTPMAMIVQRLTQEAPPLTLKGGGEPPEALSKLVAELLSRSPWRRPACAADVRSRLLEIPDFELGMSSVRGPQSPLPTVVDTGPPPLVSPIGPRVVRRNYIPDNRFRLLTMKSPPLTGRGELQRHLFDTGVSHLEDGRSGALILRGARGIGKRRLARWLKEVFSERGLATPLEIRPRATEGQEMLEALNEAIALSLGIDLRDPATWDEAAQLMAEGEDGVMDSARHRTCRNLLWGWFGPHMTYATGAAGEDEDRRRLRLELLIGVLEQLRRDKPLLLCFEGMHWADSDALSRLISHLLETDHWRSWPVFIVGTCVAGAEDGYTALFAHERVQVIDVPRLDAADADALLRAMLPLEPGARTVLCRHAGGNPYWLVRLVREMSQEGMIFESGDHFWLADGGERWLSHGRWGDDLRHRVARMAEGTPEERWDARVLYVASVLGQAPDVDMLGQVLGLVDAPEPGAMERALERWIADGVLVETAGGGIRFEHGLAYSALSQATDQLEEAHVWHRLAAELLMSGHRARMGLAGQIGRHLQSARDPRAADWLLDGAEYALAGGRYRAALDLFQRARASLDDAESQHGGMPRQVRLAIGQGRLAISRMDAELYDEAVEGLEGQPEPLASAWLAFVRGQWAVSRGELGAGEALLLQAVEDFEALSLTAESLKARERLADCLRCRGAYTEALEALGDAHEKAAIGGFTELAAQLTLLEAFIELETSRYAEALEKAQVIHQSPAAGRSAWIEARALFIKCGALLRLDRPEPAIEAGEAALSQYRRTGDLTGEMKLLNVLAMCEQERGRPGQARALGQEALALNERLRAESLKGRILNNLAIACQSLGHAGEAERHFRAALVASRRVNDMQNEARVCHNLGHHLAQRDDVEAIVCVRRSVDLLTRLALPYVADAQRMLRRMEDRFGEEGAATLATYAQRLEVLYEGALDEES
ncbi:MAG: protein kinase domain-containing protein [Bradymonadia bacterium]